MVPRYEVTMDQLMKHQIFVTNESGDQLWRYTDDHLGKPRFKVFAVEPTKRTQIKNWERSVAGADYFLNGKYVATDFIIPKGYLNRIISLLGFNLKKNPPRPRSEKQKAAFEQFRLKRVAISQGVLPFPSDKKVS